MTNEDLANHLATVVFDTIEKDKTLIKQNIAEAILKELLFRMKDEVVYSPLDEMCRQTIAPNPLYDPKEGMVPYVPAPVSGRQVLAELDKAAAERRALKEYKKFCRVRGGATIGGAKF